MGHRETAALYLKDVGAAIGYPELALDEGHRANIVFDDGLHLRFVLSPESGQMALESQLFGDGTALPRPTLRTLLEANFAGLGSEGATLAIGDQGTVLLVRRLDLGGFEAFKGALESFLGAATHFRALCREAAAQPAGANGGAGPGAAREEPLLIIRG